MTPLLSYVIVSPVKDEAAWLPQTIASVVRQTHRPLRWIIVDDGSADSSFAIAQAAAAEHAWIVAIRSRDAGASRSRGFVIVRAFNAGLAVAGDASDFIVKMDGDLFLPSHYFEWLAQLFARRPRVGIAGGRALVFRKGYWREDDVGITTVNGAFKAYRTTCFRAIGGLHSAMGWDGIDELAAKARGWEIAVATELQVLHYKTRGSRQRWWAARWEEGVGMRFMGYRWDAVLLRVSFRMVRERPLIAGGIVMLCGFVFATARCAPRVPDSLARAALRSEQRNRIWRLFRRSRPVPSADGDGPAFWTIPGKDDAASVFRSSSH